MIDKIKMIVIIPTLCFTLLAQQKNPSTENSANNLSDYGEVPINETGVIKSLMGRITKTEKFDSSIRIKLERGDSVFIVSYLPNCSSCNVTYQRINGYIEDEKISSPFLDQIRDSIKKEIALKRIKNIGDAKTIKLPKEVTDDSLRLIEKQKFVKDIFKKYGKKWGKLVSEKKIMIGMTKEMVLDSWGKPKDINRTVGEWGVHEQWIYSLDTYLYFENGKLTSWQD